MICSDATHSCCFYERTLADFSGMGRVDDRFCIKAS
jgi:hypothetical protein